jgi:hypothetical protein
MPSLAGPILPMKKYAFRTHRQEGAPTVDATKKWEEISPTDHAFCEWVRQITCRHCLPPTARQRIENLLRAFLAEAPHAGFSSTRFQSPV